MVRDSGKQLGNGFLGIGEATAVVTTDPDQISVGSHADESGIAPRRVGSGIDDSAGLGVGTVSQYEFFVFVIEIAVDAVGGD